MESEMKLFLLSIAAIFILFGCADEDKINYSNTIDDVNATYHKVLVSSLSNISENENISTWGFMPCSETSFLDNDIADKLGRPNENTNKIVYVYGTSTTDYVRYYFLDITIYDNNSCDTLLPNLHTVKFTQDKVEAPAQGMIDYYVELIKTEPYKNIYENIIYIKE